MKKTREQGSVDQDAARELQLFVENDGDLYRQQAQPILKNLATKKARGVYKHDLAVKLYGYLMESGAKKYAREFGTASEWARTFTVPTRRAAAVQFALGFEGEWDAGQYRDLLPKKYQTCGTEWATGAPPCDRRPGHAGPHRGESRKQPKVKYWKVLRFGRPPVYAEATSATEAMGDTRESGMGVVRKAVRASEKEVRLYRNLGKKILRGVDRSLGEESLAGYPAEGAPREQAQLPIDVLPGTTAEPTITDWAEKDRIFEERRRSGRWPGQTCANCERRGGACCNRDWHHSGDCCLHCGMDERGD
jgi:hypothetical protein